MLKFDSEPEQQLAVFVPVRFTFGFLFLKILFRNFRDCFIIQLSKFFVLACWPQRLIEYHV